VLRLHDLGGHDHDRHGHLAAALHAVGRAQRHRDLDAVGTLLAGGEVEQRDVVQLGQLRERGRLQDDPAVADDAQVALRDVRLTLHARDGALEREARRHRTGVGEGDLLDVRLAGDDVVERREEAGGGVAGADRELHRAVLDSDRALLRVAERARGGLRPVRDVRDDRGDDEGEHADADDQLAQALRGVVRRVGGRGAFGHGSIPSSLQSRLDR
jgi:hypothetical protein